MIYPWLEPFFLDFSRNLLAGSAPHAVLLSGGKGLGCDQLAGQFAALALCSAPVSGHACGQCKGCKLFASGSHSDFRRLSPEEPGKQIRVDDVRVLVEFVHGSSLQAGRKVAIIEPVEALNINGANALLKTLEEPAGDTLLILVADREEGVLPTIRSRCQVVQVKTPSHTQALTWLQQQFGSMQESDLDVSLQIASGAPVTAQNYLELGLMEQQSKMLDALAKVLKNDVAISQVAASWCDDLIRLRLEWMIQWFEQMVRCATLKSASQILHPDATRMFSYLCERIAIERLIVARSRLLEHLVALNGVSNPNPQLLIEAAIMEWYRLMQEAKNA